jgi:hypothetical protein
MIYKLLFSLAFFSPYNAYYNLEKISCPKWLPGTDEILPENMTLAPALELQNTMRCYCQVVKVKERSCINAGVPTNLCKQRTKDWVRDNITLQSQSNNGGFMKLPKRNLILNEN